MPETVFRDVVMRLKIQPSSKIELPDWSKSGGGAAQYFAVLDQGLTKAPQQARTLTTAFNDLTTSQEASSAASMQTSRSLDELVGTSKSAYDAIEGLLGSATKFSEVAPHVRDFAGAIVEGFGELDPAAATDAVEAIVEAAEQQFVDGRSRIDSESKRLSDSITRNMTGATQSLGQAAMSASRLVLSLKGLAGSDKDLESLAREFAAIQMSLHGFGAGSLMIHQVQESLTRVQASAAAVNATLALTGGVATAGQMAMLRMAPAAAAVSSALGPISLALGAISLAVVAVQTGVALFGESSEDSAQQSADAWQRYRAEVDATTAAIDRASAAVDRQRSATDDLMQMQKLLKGDAFGAEDIRGAMNEDAANRSDSRKVMVSGAFDAAMKTIPQQDLEKYEQANREVEDWEEKDRRQQGGLAKFERDAFAEAKTRRGEIARRTGIAELDRLEKQINPMDLPGSAGMLDKLPAGMRDEIDKAFSEELKKERATAQSRHGDTKSAERDSDRAMSEIDREEEKLKRKLGEHRTHAQALQMLQEKDLETGEYSQLKEQIERGTPLQGISALSPFLTSEDQTLLSADAATQTPQKLLAELANAGEFATEQAEHEELMQALRERRTKEEANHKELIALIGDLDGTIETQKDELTRLRRAQQQ